jgi:hypothetical protein
MSSETMKLEDDRAHKNTHDRIVSLLEDDWVHKNTHDRIILLLEDNWVHKNTLMIASFHY